ncbi:DUF4238 domain-containing protein [Halobacteria archaeon AArc-m2/3/4]|uniref:DUF4238 domain-containing protein n=1 Tax=Natronoglomus mannanivorans TaxID=2979990 RepID=A0ABT2Q897_9EURY|nr:DUF4238 domain-containing protein [Halobacteria archaeon AArc-m2/3/4]
MPPRKRQHFLPQLYMRGFTDNERLPSYQLNRREEFPPTNIRNLCYENYFYDETGDTEEAMGELEGEFARVLRTVINEESVRTLSHGEELNLFLTFITHIHARTKAAREETNEFATELTRTLLEIKTRVGNTDESQKELLTSLQNGDTRVEADALFNNQEVEALCGHILVADLEPILLKDSTGRGYIFADHPVVLDNPAFKQDLDIGSLGWKTRGLQIYFPLTTDLCLFLYDPVAYTESGAPGEVIEVGSGTVEDINKLQLVHALDAVFYREHGRELEMQILHEEIEDHRKSTQPDVEYVPGVDDRFDTPNPAIQFTRPTSEYSPDLPFIETDECEFTSIRSPQLAELHETVVEAFNE